MDLESKETEGLQFNTDDDEDGYERSSLAELGIGLDNNNDAYDPADESSRIGDIGGTANSTALNSPIVFRDSFNEGSSINLSGIHMETHTIGLLSSELQNVKLELSKVLYENNLLKGRVDQLKQENSHLSQSRDRNDEENRKLYRELIQVTNNEKDLTIKLSVKESELKERDEALEKALQREMELKRQLDHAIPESESPIKDKTNHGSDWGLIIEADREGKFVRLQNHGNDDTSIGSWILKYIAGDKQATFKFNSRQVVKAGKSLTIWSNNAGQEHGVPMNIVMKTQAWPTGDVSWIELQNSDTHVVACLEQVVHYHEAGTDPNQRCSIM